MPSSLETVRLDKWLWAARFYKTRSQSSAAVKRGKIKLNTTRTKASQLVKVGDEIEVRSSPYTFVMTVTGLAERRGSAEIGRGLYVEDDASIAARDAIQRQLAAEKATLSQPRPTTNGRRGSAKGRPTKKARRLLKKFGP